MKRTYKNHGQITTVEHNKWWKHLIIDCGGFWLKHDKDAGTYRQGMYDSKGYFTSLYWISRQEFIVQMKSCLQPLKRIK